MTRDTLISVILPTYNRAHTVGDAIASVLAQTHANLELIVVDDGSTDHTPEVLATFADPRLKRLQQPNAGASAARNAGIAAAKGDFIAFLDSDDLYLPKRLALQIDLLTHDNDAGLVYGDHYTVAGAARKLTRSCGAPPQLEQLLMGPAFHTSTMLIRRSWLDRAGTFDERLAVGEEWELTLRLVLAGCPLRCVSAPLSVVRLQSDSLTRELFRHTARVAEVLDKTFQSPTMPPRLRQKKDLFYASLYTRHATSAYLTGHPTIGRERLEHALTLTDPTLERPEANLMLTRFVGQIVGLSLGDPLQTLHLVQQHLPLQRALHRRLKRKLSSQFHLQAAFRAHAMQQPAACLRHALLAIVAAPGAIRNRGLLAICWKSIAKPGSGRSRTAISAAQTGNSDLNQELVDSGRIGSSLEIEP